MAKAKKSKAAKPAGEVKAEREKRAELADGFTPEKRVIFLAAFAESGNMTAAAKEADISRPTVYKWAQEDDDFAAQFRNAKEQACDALQAEAQRRAMGWEETRYSPTGQEFTIHKHSDTLMIFLLKGLRREVFGDKLEHAGDANNPIRHQHVHELADAELEKIIRDGE